MKRLYGAFAFIVLLSLGIAILLLTQPPGSPEHLYGNQSSNGTLDLPRPNFGGGTSVEQALNTRRSIRTYRDEPLSLSAISQILWAAQGLTEDPGHRTTPSAGALYPLEVYLVVGRVDGLERGVYRYIPEGHRLIRILERDVQGDLYKAALSQDAVRDASAVLVISGVYERTTIKYGERGVRYVQMEAGHAAQNVYLQAVSLNLGTVAIGAFSDDAVKSLTGMGDREQPLYIMPIGRK